MSSGIYCILNLVNGKRYIGQTNNLKKRKNAHLRSLKDNAHFNVHLQNAFNIYGENNFEFSILEECSIDQLDNRERFHIQKFDTTNHEKGYNIESGGGANKIVAEETRKKIAEYRTGKSLDKKTRKKISQTRINSGISRGKNNGMYGVRLIGEKNGMYGKTHTPEAREKVSKNLSNTVNNSGYFRVTIHKRKNSKQGFSYLYRWYDEDGKRRELESVDIEKLEKKVKERGLEWHKYDDRLNESMESLQKLTAEHKKNNPRRENMRGKNNPNYGRKHNSDELKKMSYNRSKSTNKTGYYRVSKPKSKKHKQGFCYKYSYIENGKNKKITAKSLDILEKRVKEKGLEWFKFEKD